MGYKVNMNKSRLMSIVSCFLISTIYVLFFIVIPNATKSESEAIQEKAILYEDNYFPFFNFLMEGDYDSSITKDGVLKVANQFDLLTGKLLFDGKALSGISLQLLLSANGIRQWTPVVMTNKNGLYTIRIPRQAYMLDGWVVDIPPSKRSASSLTPNNISRDLNIEKRNIDTINIKTTNEIRRNP